MSTRQDKTPTFDHPDSPPVGDAPPSIEGFRITEEIGRGGQAIVYRAVQLSLERPVALKVLDVSEVDGPELRARFAREALILGALDHENIVRVLDRGVSGPYLYIAMELVTGETVRQKLREGLPTIERALSIIADVCRGLDYCHAQGVLSRDLKPSNLLIDDRGRIKIADFGIAKILTGGPVESATEITRTSVVIGTPAYMAPEQAHSAREAGPAADLYSLGVTSYELLTGALPPQARHLVSGGRRPAELSAATRAVLEQMMSPLPEQRYASAGAFLAALTASLGASGAVHVPPRPFRLPPAVPVAVAMLALSLIAPAVPPAPALPGLASPATPPSPAPFPVSIRGRVKLPGPWWVGSHTEGVVALCRDPISDQTYLARMGPNGLEPLVPLALKAHTATLDGGTLWIATADDRAAFRLDLARLTAAPVRLELPFAPRALTAVPGHGVLALGADEAAWISSDPAHVQRVSTRIAGPAIVAPGSASALVVTTGAARLITPGAVDPAVTLVEPLPDTPWSRVTGAVTASGTTWLACAYGRELISLSSPRRRIPVLDLVPGDPIAIGAYLAAPVQGGLTIVDPDAGKTVFQVPLEGGVTAGVARGGRLYVALRHACVLVVLE